MSTGISNPGIEKILIEKLPFELRGKIVLIPQLKINEFASLIDFCDVFLSGDTGPVHIASAWKEPLSQKDSLRNCTSVITIFGATDSRIYGYDTSKQDTCQEINLLRLRHL